MMRVTPSAHVHEIVGGTKGRVCSLLVSLKASLMLKTFAALASRKIASCWIDFVLNKLRKCYGGRLAVVHSNVKARISE